MSRLSPLGLGAISGPSTDDSFYERQVAQIALHPVLEFTGWSIDDVVNDPIVRNQVCAYYRLCRFIEKRCDEIGPTYRYGRGRISL